MKLLNLILFPERYECYKEGMIVSIFFSDYIYLDHFNGGAFGFTARALVCHNEVFGSICDVHWNKRDADVLCRTIKSEHYGELVYYND